MTTKKVFKKIEHLLPLNKNARDIIFSKVIIRSEMNPLISLFHIVQSSEPTLSTATETPEVVSHLNVPASTSPRKDFSVANRPIILFLDIAITGHHSPAHKKARNACVLLSKDSTLDSFNNVSDIIITHIRSSRQTQTNFENGFAHTIQISRCILIYWLFVHRFP